MPAPLIHRLTRAVSRFVRMPPDYAVLRLEAELRRRTDRHPAGWLEERLEVTNLLRCINQPDLATLERAITTQGTAYDTEHLNRAVIDQCAPGSSQRIIERADSALAGYVSLLGSGPVQLGEIDWHRDYKTGLTWPFDYHTSIDAADLRRPSEVKFPWDLSRLHWLFPVGQAYRLTGGEHYAAYVRRILDHWLQANPCGWGVNWSCTMEPAMRIFSWVWLYQTFHRSKAWDDDSFRIRLLRTLYLHLRFIRRNLEITDINGNHLTADAAALVTGGAFFGSGEPLRWMQTGWKILQQEIERQVFPDGVDFEAAIPYHRLVTELFFHAAATLEENGVRIPRLYIDRLLLMAEYIRAYTKPNGNAPIIGDADDARVLPLGQQHINDHRYLPLLIAARWAPDTIDADWRQAASECLWWWGHPPVDADLRPPSPPQSYLFQDSGNAVLRSGEDYVFIDSGAIGLAGRGGHGHNDCLSFEAALLGHDLIVDSGCPTYTGDWQLRNRYRSTSAHNTPALDAEEINRFVSPRDLWSLHNDAKGQIELWHEDSTHIYFRGSHKGYQRLDPLAIVQRALILDKKLHAISWEDRIEGVSGSKMRSPLLLAPGVKAKLGGSKWLHLSVADIDFVLEWDSADTWDVVITQGKVAPSYGVLLTTTRLEWNARTESSRQIRMYLYPGSAPHAVSRTVLCHALQKCAPVKTG